MVFPALRDARVGAERVRSSLAYATDALVAAILAPGCAACARPLEHPLQGPVCAECWARVEPLRAPLCHTCGAALPSWRQTDPPETCQACHRHPGFVEAARSAGRYDGSLRQVVHAFKYDSRRTLAGRLGRLMLTSGRDLLTDATCVVPVPLHPWRYLRRGFNQAADLARHLERPVVHALWRWRATPPQTGLTAAARRRNVQHAFSLSPLLSRRTRHAHLRDRIVILVDDVRTTGATLDACARVLRDAGVREVRALTLALADPPDSRP